MTVYIIFVILIYLDFLFYYLYSKWAIIWQLGTINILKINSMSQWNPDKANIVTDFYVTSINQWKYPNAAVIKGLMDQIGLKCPPKHQKKWSLADIPKGTFRDEMDYKSN